MSADMTDWVPTGRKQTTRLGALLTTHRFMAGQTIRESAKEFGVSAATLCRIENGEMCDARTLLKLFDWLLGPAVVKGRSG